MIPYTVERRADTGVTNVTLGIWLFLASEVMLFGALFSAYALLRTAAPVWPKGADVLSLPLGTANTLVLLAMSAAAWRARSVARPRRRSLPGGQAEAGTAVRGPLLVSSALAITFLVVKGVEYSGEIARGVIPSSGMFPAMYYTLTGLHALHVAGGICANLWTIAGARQVPAALTAGRAHALTLYWAFVDVVWLVIFVLLYLS
jgi:cytochrome c oxidase subunit III